MFILTFIILATVAVITNRFSFFWLEYVHCVVCLNLACGLLCSEHSWMVWSYIIVLWYGGHIDILYNTRCVCVHWRCWSAWHVCGAQACFIQRVHQEFRVQFFKCPLRYELISFVDVCTDGWMCVLRSTSDSLMYIRCMGTDVSPPRLPSLTLFVYRWL